MEARFDIKGAETTLARMRNLAKNVQRRGARKAARAGMAIVRDAARAGAREWDDPNTPTNIAKLITIAESSRQSRRVGGVVMRVGVRGGAKSSKSRLHPWWWRLLEFGTSKMRARPVMRQALSNNVGAVTDKVVAVLNAEIDKEARR